MIGHATAAKGRAPLSVDVIYPALGTKKLKATTVKGGASGWTLVKDVDLRPTTVAKDAGWRLVQLRFMADTGAKGDWLVDDGAHRSADALVTRRALPPRRCLLVQSGSGRATVESPVCRGA